MADVTQEDREAAASGYFAWCSGNPIIPDRMKAGRADDHSMVQAFARHRTTVLAAKEAELAAERSKVEKLRAALTVFVKCARYSPHMGGDSSFMGWNQSDLRRAESHARATLAETQP